MIHKSILASWQAFVLDISLAFISGKIVDQIPYYVSEVLGKYASFSNINEILRYAVKEDVIYLERLKTDKIEDYGRNIKRYAAGMRALN